MWKDCLLYILFNLFSPIKMLKISTITSFFVQVFSFDICGNFWQESIFTSIFSKSYVSYGENTVISVLLCSHLILLFQRV